MKAQAPIRLGPFELLKPIGRGGMGVVWYGHHRTQRVPVAVKVMTDALARRPAFIHAMRNEVHAVARLDHPGIVRVYDHGELGPEAQRLGDGALRGSPYLVMAYAAHGHLTPQHINSASELKYALRALLSALSHAHARGVTHRDLKPPNILLARKRFHTGSSGPLLITDVQLELSDFGLAHAHDHQLRDTSSPLAGTPHFMAPEQLRGDWRSEGPWTDLYALGSIAYLLICGHILHEDTDVRASCQRRLDLPLPPLTPRFDLPEGLRDWLSRLLAPDPTDRFQRAADALDALDALGRADAPHPGQPWRHPTPSWREHAAPPPTAALAGVGMSLYGLRPVPLVGREPLRDRLWGALTHVCTSRTPAARLLSGPAGTGKSRLLDWLVERAHADGLATVLRARNSANLDPRAALAGMLARHLRAHDLDRAGLLERVSALLPDVDATERRALAELLATGQPGEPLLRFSTPEAWRGTLRKALLRLTGPRPLLLFIDDVHWSAEALDLAIELLEVTPESPLLILLAARSDHLERQPETHRAAERLVAHPSAERVELHPLPPPEHRRLVEHLLGLEAQVALQVAERTAGNPMFAVELVGDWIRRGLLIRGARGFELASEHHGERLPDNIHAHWFERLQRFTQPFPEPERASLALEIAAALGNPFSLATWDAICERLQLPTSDDLLEPLTRRGLAVLEGPDRLAFTHEMLRESLERHAREQQRWGAHHDAIVDALQRSPEPPGERLGLHLLAAERFDEALPRLLHSLEERRVAGDFRWAATLAQRCQRALTRGEVPRSDPMWGELALRRAHLFASQGLLDEAEGELQGVDVATRHHPDAWRHLAPRLGWLRGVVAFKRGELQTGVAFFEQALAVARPQHDALTVADCLRGLGEAAKAVGSHREARQQLEQALAIYTSLGHQDRLGNCLSGLAGICWRMGDADDAQAFMERALEHFTAIGSLSGEARCLNNMGEAARYRGDIEEAERSYRRALEIGRALDLPMTRLVQLNLAIVLLARRQFAAAHRLLHQSRVSFEHDPQPVYLAFVHTLMLPCLADARAWTLWDDHLERARALIQEHALADADLARHLELTAQLATDAGQTERAQAALQLALTQRERLGDDEAAESLRRQLHT